MDLKIIRLEDEVFNALPARAIAEVKKQRGVNGLDKCVDMSLAISRLPVSDFRLPACILK